MRTIAYAIGDEGERIPLREAKRRAGQEGEVTIVAESAPLASGVTFIAIEWVDPFGVGLDFGSSDEEWFPLTLGPGNTITVDQQFHVREDTGVTTTREPIGRSLTDRMKSEEERIADIQTAYRDGRARRPRWHMVAELYLPLPASAVGAILEVLADLNDRVVVRTNPSNDNIWYIGWYEDAPLPELVDIPTALAPGQFDRDDPTRP